MKEIEVTVIASENVKLCSTCKKVTGDVTLYLPVKYDYFETIGQDGVLGRDSRYYKIAKVAFKPVETCQCQESGRMSEQNLAALDEIFPGFPDWYRKNYDDQGKYTGQNTWSISASTGVRSDTAEER